MNTKGAVTKLSLHAMLLCYKENGEEGRNNLRNATISVNKKQKTGNITQGNVSTWKAQHVFLAHCNYLFYDWAIYDY